MFKKVLVVSCFCFYYRIGCWCACCVGSAWWCCSGRGGVCGCSCCDGRGLSAVCIPCYPECNKVKVDSFGYDRAEMSLSKGATNWDDRPILSRGREGWGWSDGWEMAVIYAVGVCLVLFFGRMRYIESHVQ